MIFLLRYALWNISLASFAIGEEYSLDGTVYIEDAPLANAVVYAFSAQQEYWQSQTDTNGYFTMDLPEGWYRILAISPTQSNAVPAFFPNTLDYCSATRISLVDNTHLENMILSEGFRIEGKIATSQAVQNMLVIAEPVDASSGFIRGSWADPDGNFSIQGIVPSAEVHIGIEADGLPDQWWDIASGSQYKKEDTSSTIVSDSIMVTESIQTLEGITISGLVYHDSTPLPNAQITVYSNSQLRNARSDQNGEYIVQGLPAGEVLAWSSKDGYATSYSPDDDRPTEFVPVLEEGSFFDLLDIEMPIESKLHITLKDSGTEEIIEGASVLLYNDNRTVGRGQPVDAEGVASINGLHAGMYQAYMYAENDGYSNGFALDALGEEEWIELGEAEEKNITYYLAPTEQIIGQVLDDQGNPIYNTLVVATKQDSDAYARTYSDSNGEFILYGITEGVWSIQANYKPICPNDIDYIETPESIATLGAPRELEVTLTLLLDDDQDGMPTSWEEEYGLDPYVANANEDPDGDGYSNLEEYTQGTDPMEKHSKPPKQCSCTNSDSAIFLPMVWVVYRGRRKQLAKKQTTKQATIQ